MSGTIGSRLREAREAAGMTLSDVRQHLHGLAVGPHERGEARARLATSCVRRLAEMYGVRFEWLQTGEGPMREGEEVPS